MPRFRSPRRFAQHRRGDVWFVTVAVLLGLLTGVGVAGAMGGFSFGGGDAEAWRPGPAPVAEGVILPEPTPARTATPRRPAKAAKPKRANRRKPARRKPRRASRRVTAAPAAVSAPAPVATPASAPVVTPQATAPQVAAPVQRPPRPATTPRPAAPQQPPQRFDDSG